MGVGEGVEVRGARLGLGVDVAVGGCVSVALGSVLAVRVALGLGVDVNVDGASICASLFTASTEKVEQLKSPPEIIIKRNTVPTRNRVPE